VDFLAILAEHEGESDCRVHLRFRGLPAENSQHPQAKEHDELILSLEEKGKHESSEELVNKL
jgi:hypothetical protein